MRFPGRIQSSRIGMPPSRTMPSTMVLRSASGKYTVQRIVSSRITEAEPAGLQHRVPGRNAIFQSRAGPANVACVIEQCLAKFFGVALIAREMKQQSERDAHIGYLIGGYVVVRLLAASNLGYGFRNEVCRQESVAMSMQRRFHREVATKFLLQLLKRGSVVEQPRVADSGRSGRRWIDRERLTASCGGHGKEPLTFRRVMEGK